MRDFNKEELDMLQEYERRFKTAIDLGFVRNLEPRYLNVIKKIYDSASGEDYPLNGSCSHCVVKFMKLVGNKFYKDLEKYKEKAEKLVDILDDVFGDVPDDEPKKPVVKKPQNKKPNKRK